MGFKQVDVTEGKDLYATLNDGQKSAVNCGSKRIVCAAGAGTGKTHTLLARIQRKILVDGIDPESILVLTFTHAAAGEFQARWDSVCPFNESPEFSTFHALCYKLICSDPDVCKALGFTKTPNVASGYASDSLMREAAIMADVSLTKEQMDLAYEPYDFDEIEVTIFRKMLKRLMVKQNKVTFDYMNVGVSQLFEERHPSIQKHLGKYKCIFVDEFQDTDPAQFAFINAFDDAELFCVGDVRQALYGFRGADSTIMKGLIDSEDWETVKLTRNYRSTKQICDYANHIFRSSDPYSLNLETDIDGIPVEHVTKRSFDSDPSTAISSASGSCALITRTNRGVDALRKLLVDNGIPFKSNRGSVSRAAILAALDDKSLYDYLRYSLNDEGMSEFMRLRYSIGDVPLGMLVNLAPKAFKRVSSIREDPAFQELKAKLSAEELDEEGVIAEMQSIDAEASVYVGTVHSVKGLEYDNVLVYGDDGDEFRLDTEEGLNIYYVACTRPKSRLVLIHS